MPASGSARSSAHRLSWSATILAAVRQKLQSSHLSRFPEPPLKRTLPKREALVRTLVNGALMKDVKALQALLAIMRATGLISEEPEAAPPQELSPEDEVLIADYVRRKGRG